MDGMPSGMVTKRRITSPCWKVSRMPPCPIPAGSRNSPAWIGSELPSSLARNRKPSAEVISPSSSSLFATAVSVAPEGTMNAVSFSTCAEPNARLPKITAERSARAASTPAAKQPRRRMSVDLLHHQAGVGSAEAEAVVQHGANLALLCLVRDEIDAFGPFVRIVEVERRRNDLVANREDAEDALNGTGAAQQVTDGGLGAAHRST